MFKHLEALDFFFMWNKKKCNRKWLFLFMIKTVWIEYAGVKTLYFFGNAKLAWKS